MLSPARRPPQCPPTLSWGGCGVSAPAPPRPAALGRQASGWRFARLPASLRGRSPPASCCFGLLSPQRSRTYGTWKQLQQRAAERPGSRPGRRPRSLERLRCYFSRLDFNVSRQKTEALLCGEEADLQLLPAEAAFATSRPETAEGRGCVCTAVKAMHERPLGTKVVRACALACPPTCHWTPQALTAADMPRPPPGHVRRCGC